MFIDAIPGQRIAVTLTYNGNAVQNEAHSVALRALLTELEHVPDPLEPDVKEPYYVFTGVLTRHQVTVLKIIPPRVKRPPSDEFLRQGCGNGIGPGAVEYATARELDREGRNFGLSRAFAYFNADRLIEMDTIPTALEITDALARLAGYTEETWGRIVLRAAFERAGYLAKDVRLADARTEWSART